MFQKHFFNMTEYRNECRIVFGGDCFFSPRELCRISLSKRTSFASNEREVKIV